MSRNFLIIETSDNDSFVAIHLSTGKIVMEALPRRNQALTLLPAIKKILTTEVDFIAIGVGPGSFTGTRVGVMTAKALSFARSIPLVPFCSLKRFIPNEDGPFNISIDGKSRGFYTLRGVKEGKTISFTQPFSHKLATQNCVLTLNLTSLAHYLLEEFEINKGLPHCDVKVSYFEIIENSSFFRQKARKT